MYYIVFVRIYENHMLPYTAVLLNNASFLYLAHSPSTCMCFTSRREISGVILLSLLIEFYLLLVFIIIVVVVWLAKSNSNFAMRSKKKDTTAKPHGTMNESFSSILRAKERA